MREVFQENDLFDLCAQVFIVLSDRLHSCRQDPRGEKKETAPQPFPAWSLFLFPTSGVAGSRLTRSVPHRHSRDEPCGKERLIFEFQNTYMSMVQRAGRMHKVCREY